MSLELKREILFRGKRMGKGENREWVQGCLVEGKGHVFNGNSFICPCVTSASAEDAELSLGGFVEVDPSTVGQYTGLTDKNGVKIFEGDIIRGTGKGAKPDNFVIRWSAPCCGFSAGEGKRVWPNLNQATVSGYEVVWNIFDTPELLKGSNP